MAIFFIFVLELQVGGYPHHPPTCNSTWHDSCPSKMHAKPQVLGNKKTHLSVGFALTL